MFISLKEVSFLPGRIRFKDDKLYHNKALGKYIFIYAESLYGINYVNINPNTGSLLIQYDEEKIDHELIKSKLESAISGVISNNQDKLKKHERYFETVRKRDNAKRKFITFGLIYLAFKIKQSIWGKFSISRNIKVLQVASAVTLVGGYPMLKKCYKRFTRNVPTDSEILLKLTAMSFTLMRESAKGVFILMMKELNDYIKYSADAECQKLLNISLSKSSSMAWTVDSLGNEILLPVTSLNIGDIIFVHKGEISPADGVVIEGNSLVNSLYYNGQPIILNIGTGNKVFEGMSILSHDIKVKISRLPDCSPNSTFNIDDLLIKKRIQNYEDKMGHISLGAAAISFILTKNMMNALSMMLILSPSSAALAMSVGIKSYVSMLTNYNIYLRNPNVFENIINAKNIVFDKTGTLTYGNMKIAAALSFNKNYTSEDLLSICTACEVDNYHPISITLQDNVKGKYDINKVKSSVLIPSQGIKAIYDNHQILIGSKAFMLENLIKLDSIDNVLGDYEDTSLSIVFVAIDAELSGLISMEEILRGDSLQLINKLKHKGLSEIAILSGDDPKKTSRIANSLGIKKFYSNTSSSEKKSIIEAIKCTGPVIMVGDGINDVDAMNAADVGISFVNSACDKIKLKSDCIIFEDNISRVADLISLSEKSFKKININISFAQAMNFSFATMAILQGFNTFTAKSLNTLNSLVILILNERIRWTVPDKLFPRN